MRDSRVDPSRVENVEEEEDGAATDAEFILQSSIIILICGGKPGEQWPHNCSFFVFAGYVCFRIDLLCFGSKVVVFRTELFIVFQIRIDFRFVLLFQVCR